MGLLFLDKDARTDGTAKRRSTFDNAFPRLRLFTGRSDPAGRDEQFERLYLLLVDANPFNPGLEASRQRPFPVSGTRRRDGRGDRAGGGAEL
jgi:hypothetical protein